MPPNPPSSRSPTSAPRSRTPRPRSRPTGRRRGSSTRGGSSPVTLPEQQLTDLNAELYRACGPSARPVRGQGRPDPQRPRRPARCPTSPTCSTRSSFSGWSSSRSRCKAQIAQLPRRFLPGHPRMRSSTPRSTISTRRSAGEAKRSLPRSRPTRSCARGARRRSCAASTGSSGAATANDAGVRVRALEREASAQRDLLDTYLRRYREAVARQRGDFLPADARIVSQVRHRRSNPISREDPMTAAAAAGGPAPRHRVRSDARELASGRPMRERASAASRCRWFPTRCRSAGTAAGRTTTASAA